MALEQKLSLKLAQKLVMTPSLQQAIKLLQMTRLELQGVLAQELVENPVLEESAELGDDEAAPAPEAAAETSNDLTEVQVGEGSLENIDLDAYFGDYMESSGYASVWEERQAAPLENTLSREEDLYDYLLWQLNLLDVSPRRREIAELIIGNLDADGFLVATPEEIQASAPPSAELDPYRPEEVAAALALVRSLDPPGIACADLCASLVCQIEARRRDEATELAEAAEVVAAAEAELREMAGHPALEDAAGEALDDELFLDAPPPCLAQLGEVEGNGHGAGSPGQAPDRFDLARAIVEHHWDAFLHRQFPLVVKALGVDLETLKPAVDLIRTLDPRPGRRFSSEQPQYIEPDVAVIKVGDDYVIQLNDDGMPRLRISRSYRRMLHNLRHEGNHSDAQQFIQDKMRSALWLIKSLDQRQRTIYKVADSIIRQQRAFFDRGIEHLRPMVLRDVADDIGMHESTVSRVVSNKYMHTPRGLFPLKFFFHSGIDRDYGENISSLTVKRKIQHLIQEEDPQKPLSDSDLMRILKREGIQIARRTVAKYRDELSISSSTDRKRVF